MQSKAEYLKHIDSIESRTNSNAEHLAQLLVLLSLTTAWVHVAKRLVFEVN